MRASRLERERRALLEGAMIEDDEIHLADNDGFVRGILESGQSMGIEGRTDLRESEDSLEMRRQDIEDRLAAAGYVESENENTLDYAMMANAIKDGDLGEVKRLVKNGYDLDECGEFGTPLHMAASMVRPEIMQFFIDAGISPDVGWRSSDGSLDRIQTPLFMFATGNLENDDENGIRKCLKVLGDAGASLNGVNGEGKPLALAIMNGMELVFEFLMERGADVTGEPFRHGGNFIHEAIRRCQYGFMTALIEKLGKGAINEKDDDGRTCLDLAEKMAKDASGGSRDFSKHFRAMADYLTTNGGRRG